MRLLDFDPTTRFFRYRFKTYVPSFVKVG